MAKDLNRCEFIGRLGDDPTIRYTPDGKAVANISIACGESWVDKQTGEKKEKTEWVRIVAFNKLAEIIGEYLNKGSQIYISGKLQTRKWQDNNGDTKYTTEIIADQLQMLDSRCGTNDTGSTQAPDRSQQGAPPNQDDFSDKIPFSPLKNVYLY